MALWCLWNAEMLQKIFYTFFNLLRNFGIDKTTSSSKGRLTTALHAFKPVWLLHMAMVLKLCGSAALCCPAQTKPLWTWFWKMTSFDKVIWYPKSLYTSLKARDFSEQLLFSSLEIPDACWIFEAKIVKTIFSSSPCRENSPYPLPTWHVYKYNLLSLLAAIQIMGFILHPTQMAVTESGQEGRRSERKHMKLYWQDLKGTER